VNYRVVVRNACGSVTSNTAFLIVRRVTGKAPVITQQPANVTLTAGARAAFKVGATGTAPLSYQWFRDSVKIDSARDSVYITPPTDSTMDSTRYRVVVKNSFGAVASSWAVLHVLTKPNPDSTIFEAEKALLSGAVVAKNHPGFTGTGFADYVNPSGDFVEWTVPSASFKPVSVLIRYANGSTTSRPLEIKVNGITVKTSLAFPSTGSWDTWKTVTIIVNLRPGPNKIRATAIGSNGPNVDHLRTL